MNKLKLSKIPFFSHLDSQKLQLVHYACELKNFRKNDLVIQQGEKADGVYIILKGSVSVEMDGKTITSLDENDFFGELSLVANEPRSANIIASSETLETLFLSKEAFDEIKDELGDEVRHEILQRIIENYED